jgi:AmmeMemoRadiSam system protein A
MSSTEASVGPTGGPVLLGVARAAVEHGVRTGRPLDVEPGDYDPPLRLRRASFVTLRLDGALRGCTGSLEASQPLVVDVARSAHRSAFGDPRFPPVEARELSRLALHVSVLSILEPLPAPSEAELLARLRPGIDGLVLSEGALTSTFLPSVWESLPSPDRFLAELKRKAGLPLDHWSPTLRFQRYTVEEFE